MPLHRRRHFCCHARRILWYNVMRFEPWPLKAAMVHEQAAQRIASVRFTNYVMKEDNNMKKILLLGGSAQQIVAIETAKKYGYYTVLCDYLPDNPGQYHADKFYQVSTTDPEAVLSVASAEKVDGVIAYASDPAAPTAAYVAEKLGLPGNPYRSVEILCNKDLFRGFLAENGFNTPKAKGYSSVEDAKRDLEDGYFRYPVLAKPTDSSGSKGVGRIDGIAEADEKLKSAMERSRGGRILIEEYVEAYGYQIAGDGFSRDGKLVFRCFGNDHFDTETGNPFVPVSASFPSILPEQTLTNLHNEIQRLLTLLGMKDCCYNFDARADAEGRPYLMEVAPRSGGNYIPDVIRYATGVNLVEYAVLSAMGETGVLPELHIEKTRGFWAYYALHSSKDGILKEIVIDDDFRKQHIAEDHITASAGDRVYDFVGANVSLGCLILKFDSMEEMLENITHPEKWLRIEVEE